MSETSFVSTHSALQDIVFLNGIAVPELVGEDFVTQAIAVLQKMESELSKFGMSKHNVVNIRTTVGDLDSDLSDFNRLYDDWTTKDLTILPTMSACQLTEFEGGPRLMLSVTATQAPKVTMPAGLTRSGGGEPAFMIRSEDSSDFGKQMHFPWSSVVEAGDMVWLCGHLDVSVGNDTSMQAEADLQWVDEMLAAAGLSKEAVIHTHIMVPASLPGSELENVLTFCAQRGWTSTEVIHATKTCADCKVEITCLASRSTSVRLA
jgi:enamine deaminase RidA (YjgF/YER057c/UK114 family)